MDGNYYALAVTERLGLEGKGGMVRIGAVHYNTVDEIQWLGSVLRAMVWRVATSSAQMVDQMLCSTGKGKCEDKREDPATNADRQACSQGERWGGLPPHLFDCLNCKGHGASTVMLLPSLSPSGSWLAAGA